jgi:hypothetical protein
MNLEFIPMNREETKHMLRIDGAKILGGTFRNFSGVPDKYNPNGKRSFAIRIDDEEIKDALLNNTNEFGKGWNVRIKPPREEGDDPLMFLKVALSFKNGRGPKIYLQSGDVANLLDEEDIDQLDEIDIDHVDAEIRPYDDQSVSGPFRAAYLQSLWVYQSMPRDRFAARYANMGNNEDETLPI